MSRDRKRKPPPISLAKGQKTGRPGGRPTGPRNARPEGGPKRGPGGPRPPTGGPRHFHGPKREEGQGSGRGKPRHFRGPREDGPSGGPRRDDRGPKTGGGPRHFQTERPEHGPSANSKPRRFEGPRPDGGPRRDDDRGGFHGERGPKSGGDGKPRHFRDGRGGQTGARPFQRHGGGDGERPSPEAMQKMLVNAGIDLDDQALKRLWTFHNLLRERNHDRDLTRLIGFHTIVTRHYIDCMLIGKMYDLPSPLLDVGTGAGFPGIPLKIQNPDLEITLAEPRPRRVLFLKEAIQKLGLQKTDVFDHKVVSRSFKKPVDAVITRALETMDKTCLRTSACLGVGGELILMKGPNADEELKETQKRFAGKFRLKLDESYVLPGTTHDRRLIVLEKLTPPEIPHGADAAAEETEWDGDADEI